MDTDRLMRSMMQNMGMSMPFGDLFGGLFGNPFEGGPSSQVQSTPLNPMSSMMLPRFMSPMSSAMMDPFQSMQQALSMTNNGGNGFSYCSSSVTSYTTDAQGRPQVYQQSRELKSGPGGLKETKSSIRDTRTGHQELAIGHHINDRAHIKKKSKNVYTGDEEQAEEFVNIDEAEAETFEQTWARQARNFTPSPYNQIQYGQPHDRSRNNRLALTSSAHEDSHRQSHHPTSSYVNKPTMKIKKKKKSKEARV